MLPQLVLIMSSGVLEHLTETHTGHGWHVSFEKNDANCQIMGHGETRLIRAKV